MIPIGRFQLVSPLRAPDLLAVLKENTTVDSKVFSVFTRPPNLRFVGHVEEERIVLRLNSLLRAPGRPTFRGRVWEEGGVAHVGGTLSVWLSAELTVGAGLVSSLSIGPTGLVFAAVVSMFVLLSYHGERKLLIAALVDIACASP
jgi:hypothetical protein